MSVKIQTTVKFCEGQKATSYYPKFNIWIRQSAKAIKKWRYSAARCSDDFLHRIYEGIPISRLLFMNHREEKNEDIADARVVGVTISKLIFRNLSIKRDSETKEIKKVYPDGKNVPFKSFQEFKSFIRKELETKEVYATAEMNEKESKQAYIWGGIFTNMELSEFVEGTSLEDNNLKIFYKNYDAENENQEISKIQTIIHTALQEASEIKFHYSYEYNGIENDDAIRIKIFHGPLDLILLKQYILQHIFNQESPISSFSFIGENGTNIYEVNRNFIGKEKHLKTNKFIHDNASLTYFRFTDYSEIYGVMMLLSTSTNDDEFLLTDSYFVSLCLSAACRNILPCLRRHIDDSFYKTNGERYTVSILVILKWLLNRVPEVLDIAIYDENDSTIPAIRYPNFRFIGRFMTPLLSWTTGILMFEGNIFQYNHLSFPINPNVPGTVEDNTEWIKHVQKNIM